MSEKSHIVTLRLASDEEKGKWDALVEASPHGTVFHTWAWVSAMAGYGEMKVLGEKIKPVFHPLIAENDGKDIGLIPLYEFRGRFLTYVLSPPLNTSVTYLGPCLNFPENLKRSSWEGLHRSFHNAIDEYIKKLGAHCVWMRTSPNYDDVRPYLWLGYNVTPLYNYVIDLTYPLDTIWENSHENFRKRVRKAEKEGYSSVEGSLKDVETLYVQQSNRYAEKGLHMNMPLDYLRELWGNMGGKALRIFKTELNGEYATAALRTCYKDKITGWIGVPKDTQKGGTANYLIHWNIIQWAKTRGYREYEIIWALEESLNESKTRLNPRLGCFYSVVKMSRLLNLIYEFKRFIMGGKIWGAEL